MNGIIYLGAKSHSTSFPLSVINSTLLTNPNIINNNEINAKLFPFIRKKKIITMILKYL
jgi:hypothetical protein